MRIFHAAVVLCVAATSARAETFPVITNPIVLKECGACHMAFPPETLAKATWEKIIGNLADHFGENAALDPAQTAEILAFHVQNAADVSPSRAASRWVTPNAVARIIEAPRFIKKHGQCPDAVWNHEKVKSKSNCLACHTAMQTAGSTDADLRFLPQDLLRACGEDD
jgi:hypothetical protein